jgi:tetratricopeptide (TPR) repeat protein
LRVDYNRAIADYSKAIELDPKSAYVYNKRGSVYSSKKDYDYAIADYVRAIELEPKTPYYYNNIADIYFNLGKLDKAIDFYQKRIELSPDDAINANLKLGIIFWHKRSEIKAREYFNKVLAILEIALQRKIQSRFALLCSKALALLGLERSKDAFDALREGISQKLPSDVISDFSAYDLLATAPKILPDLAEMRRLLEELK